MRRLLFQGVNAAVALATLVLAGVQIALGTDSPTAVANDPLRYRRSRRSAPHVHLVSDASVVVGLLGHGVTSWCSDLSDISNLGD